MPPHRALCVMTSGAALLLGFLYYAESAGARRQPAVETLREVDFWSPPPPPPPPRLTAALTTAKLATPRSALPAAVRGSGGAAAAWKLSAAPPPPASSSACNSPKCGIAPWEPVCQVTFGRRVCMRGATTVDCPGNVDLDRKEGATPLQSGAWKISASNYTYFMDRGLVAALAKVFAGSSVLELGAGKGCYTAALRRAGLPWVGAVDGVPDIAAMTHGLVATADLTKPLQADVADWVLCLEVAEHIPRPLEERLLANLHAHNRKGVVLSWSDNAGGNGHVNIRGISYVVQKMQAIAMCTTPPPRACCAKV